MNIHIIGVPEEKERQKGLEKASKDNSWKLPEHGKGNSQPSWGSTEAPKQDKPKKEYKTHSNQTDKN